VLHAHFSKDHHNFTQTSSPKTKEQHTSRRNQGIAVLGHAIPHLVRIRITLHDGGRFLNGYIDTTVPLCNNVGSLLNAIAAKEQAGSRSREVLGLHQPRQQQLLRSLGRIPVPSLKFDCNRYRQTRILLCITVISVESSSDRSDSRLHNNAHLSQSPGVIFPPSNFKAW
jgi:hypothetical protein